MHRSVSIPFCGIPIKVHFIALMGYLVQRLLAVTDSGGSYLRLGQGKWNSKRKPISATFWLHWNK